MIRKLNLMVRNEPEYNVNRINLTNEEKIINWDDDIHCRVESFQSERVVKWLKKAASKPDGTWKDIYYFIEKKTQRLTSLNDVKSYCNKNCIKYRPELLI